jgi:diamine N-acetyltransferase
MSTDPQPLPEPGAEVSLREVTRETAREIMRLDVTELQKQFVAPNSVSIAQAYFDREHAWFRAIYAADTPVGFVMIYDDPQEPEYFLWRFMIDARYQGSGYGWRALELVTDHVRSRPKARYLFTSCVPAEGGPCPFYEKFGFRFTGEEDGGELEMKLDLFPDRLQPETPAG